MITLTKEQLRELGGYIREEIQWPEIMDLETAGRYMDRGAEGVRHLVRKRLLPKIGIDSKIQIRKSDIDALAERSLI